MKKLLAVAVALALSPSVHADGLETPGSIWNSLETTPIEKGNLIDYFHVDQGVVVGHIRDWSVIPYVALNASKNSDNNEWNNRIELEGGAKLARHFDNGGVDLKAALATEHSFKYNSYYANTSQTELVLSADGWYSWQKFKESQTYATPGYISAVIGNLSPLEENNLIGVARLEQAITFAKVKDVNVDALYWGQVSFDGDKYAWNNRIVNGLGVRAVLPFTGGVASLTGGVECIKQSFGTAGDSVCGPTIKLDIWAGWNKIGSAK